MKKRFETPKSFYDLELTISEKETTQLDWETLEPVGTGIKISISGTKYQRTAGRPALLSYGQVYDDELKKFFPELYFLWREHHLNDLKAGTKLQSGLLEDMDLDPNYSYYSNAIAYLVCFPNESYDRNREKVLQSRIPDIVLASDLSQKEKDEGIKRTYGELHKMTMLYDRGYEYGTKWFFMQVPKSAITRLKEIFS